MTDFKPPRTVLFLPDAGPRVGFGHVGRCIALAQAFEARGWTSIFSLADGAARQEVRRHGFRTSTRTRSATIAIVDSYRRPAALVRVAGHHARVLAAIDDLHQVRADQLGWVIRPALGERGSRGVLGGARFLPLRREYWALQQPVRSDGVRRVLVTLGAYPPTEALSTVIEAIRMAAPAARIDVVLGLSRSRVSVTRDGVVFHHRLPSLRPLLSRSDLVVTAAGQTMYECFATGTPTVAVSTADNQTRQLNAAIRAGAIVDGGRMMNKQWAAKLERSVARAIAEASLRRRTSRAAATLVDGKGALRVVDTLVRSVP